MKILAYLLEAIDKEKVLQSSFMRRVAQALPQLGKDLVRYVDQENYKGFIEYVNEVIKANNEGKTNALHPKLSKEVWQDLLQVVDYLRKADPKLGNAAKNGDVWSHERWTKEEAINLNSAFDLLVEHINKFLKD